MACKFLKVSFLVYVCLFEKKPALLSRLFFVVSASDDAAMLFFTCHERTLFYVMLVLDPIIEV